jgi:outer membrane biosynthesis protein TonB
VKPFPHAHTASGDKLAIHSQIRGLLMSLPADSMLLSICELLHPMDVVDRMADGIPLETQTGWAMMCEATADWLEQVPLHRRRYYVAAQLPSTKRAWYQVLADAAADVNARFGVDRAPVSELEIQERQRQAHELEVRLSGHVELRRVSAGEVCWMYARAMRRDADEPPFDANWEPPEDAKAREAREDGRYERPRGVLAQLTESIVKEGGYKDDEDRPRHRRYVRIDTGGYTSYQTVMAMADMPHYFAFPGGGGEWLYHADRVGFPVDWCVRIRSVRNADAQIKVRRKHRDLIGQVDEYDGDLTGAPPQLASAIQSIDEQRAQLGANPAEPELQVTVLMSVAAPTLVDLEHRATALIGRFEPQEYGLARPTAGQTALLRAMLPGTAAPLVSRDYTQFMLTSDLAAGSPFCGPEVGDPQGLLLGVSLDGGNNAPVLFDPAFGPKANASPSLAAVGRLGSGKSYFLKRLCWDTVARGGQVVTIDRTPSGEYVRFAESIPGNVQIVRLEAGADVHLDPMRSFHGDDRATVSLGFLSLLAGSSTQSEEGAALAEAVDAVSARPDPALSDVIDELERMGADPNDPDEAARALARRLSHYRRSATGQLAFGKGKPISLDADFVIFWAPNLALADRETLSTEMGMRMMLPEQVLGQALLYLVAAVGRRVVFSDPRRFAAALYDEAWALLASPHGQKLLIEGVRDGRKHNGAIWLASQHPNDFAIAELEDLLGSRFVFRQARQAIPAALRFLGTDDSADAAATLESGLDTGQCLYRDVRDRVGLIQVLPPAIREIEDAMNTAPGAGHEATFGVNDPEDEELDFETDLGEILHTPEGPVERWGLGAYEDDEDDEPPGPEVPAIPEKTGGGRRLSLPPRSDTAPPRAPSPAPAPAPPPAPSPAPAASPQPAPVPPPEPVPPPTPEPEPVAPAAAAAAPTNGGPDPQEQAAAAARAQARSRRRSPLAQALAEEGEP